MASGYHQSYPLDAAVVLTLPFSKGRDRGASAGFGFDGLDRLLLRFDIL